MLSLAPRPVGRAACGVLPRACSPTRRFRCSPPHKVLFLGDFVDRGPDSRGVLEWLSNLPAAMPGQARLPRARAPLGCPRVRPLLQQRSAAKAGRRFRAQPRQRANPPEPISRRVNPTRPQELTFLAGNHDFACAAFLGLLPHQPSAAAAAARRALLRAAPFLRADPAAASAARLPPPQPERGGCTLCMSAGTQPAQPAVQPHGARALAQGAGALDRPWGGGHASAGGRTAGRPAPRAAPPGAQAATTRPRSPTTKPPGPCPVAGAPLGCWRAT